MNGSWTMLSVLASECPVLSYYCEETSCPPQKKTYKRKHLVGDYLWFQRVSPWSSWQGAWQKTGRLGAGTTAKSLNPDPWEVERRKSQSGSGMGFWCPLWHISSNKVTLPNPSRIVSPNREQACKYMNLPHSHRSLWRLVSFSRPHCSTLRWN